RVVLGLRHRDARHAEQKTAAVGRHPGHSATSRRRDVHFTSYSEQAQRHGECLFAKHFPAMFVTGRAAHVILQIPHPTSRQPQGTSSSVSRSLVFVHGTYWPRSE